jgi:hypothetical protein
LFNQLFIVTVRNSIHYDLFHVRQNRSYEVGICFVEGKGAHTHSAQEQKYTKTKESTSMREKIERKVLGHNAKHLEKKAMSSHPLAKCECARRRRRPPAGSVRICPKA